MLLWVESVWKEHRRFIVWVKAGGGMQCSYESVFRTRFICNTVVVGFCFDVNEKNQAEYERNCLSMMLVSNNGIVQLE